VSFVLAANYLGFMMDSISIGVIDMLILDLSEDMGTEQGPFFPLWNRC